MEKDIQYILGCDTGYRIRCVRGLTAQIRADYDEMNRLWMKWINGSNDNSTETEMMRLMSWLRQEIGLYRGVASRGIEGICWGEINEIEKDLSAKENVMMRYGGLSKRCDLRLES